MKSHAFHTLFGKIINIGYFIMFVYFHLFNIPEVLMGSYHW